MLSGSQLAGGLGHIPYLLASGLQQPALKSHHEVDTAKEKKEEEEEGEYNLSSADKIHRNRETFNSNELLGILK